MSIGVKEAIQILSHVLRGNFSEPHFLHKNVAPNAMEITPEYFSTKIKDKAFTLADHEKLAEYFKLPEGGYKVFQAADEAEFHQALKDLKVGIYEEDPSRILSQHFLSTAQNSHSSLNFVRTSRKGGPLRGFSGPDNRTDSDGIKVTVGDCGFVEYRWADAGKQPTWFSLFDVHSGSGKTRLINPVYRESSIEISAELLRYPSADVIEISDAQLIGAGRMYAVAVSEPMLLVIRDEASRMLKNHNRTDSRDARKNRFDGYLDEQALLAIEKISRSCVCDVAVLEYTQYAQQP